MFWGEVDIGLDIITVFRVLFIFYNFIFINNADVRNRYWGEIDIGLDIITVFMVLFIFINNVNVENCGSFKSFGFIYIYIYIYIYYNN